MDPAHNPLVVSGQFDPLAPETALLLPDGRLVQLPTSLLVASAPPPLPARTVEPTDGQDQVIPLIEETLQVGKRTVETGKVRLHKTVQTYETAINEPLAAHTFEVERIAVDQVIEDTPGIRQEGNTTIYPVLEERLVLTRQLVLKEELRITRRDAVRQDTQNVTLRREHVEFERTPAAAAR